MSIKIQSNKSQVGFTLVELMVGLVIGLIATLAIMQTFSVFEGQKRTTTGNADAQVNGSIALYTIQRQLQQAGYGLPIFDANDLQNNSALKCSPTTIDHDANVVTPKVDIFPISITNGGTATASDSVTVTYFTPSSSGGLPTNIVTKSGSILGVENTLGCAYNDIALVVAGTSCLAGKVTSTDSNLLSDTTHITLNGPDVASMSSSSRLTCLGAINVVTFAVNSSNELTMNINGGGATPVISDIVNMQAQYGISASTNSNVITNWVDASGAWATPGTSSLTCSASTANRNCIRAVRIALVARNGTLEKSNVTSSAIQSSWGYTFDLSNNANWAKYRYREYDTIIPLRNLTWSGQWL